MWYEEYSFKEWWKEHCPKLSRKEALEEFEEEKRENYHEYLESRDWEELREDVLERDDDRCVDCGKEAQCVHHTRYDNLYDDAEADDCISLCNKCHKKRHLNNPKLPKWD